MRAIRFHQPGGPEVLTVDEVADPVPTGDQLLINVTASGVNYADIERVAGVYDPPKVLPHILGGEVVGRTADGRRIAGLTRGGGGYATRAAVEAHHAVEVPDPIDDGQALAVLVQGLTAWHLLRSAARLTEGETVVVHAAAGGVGSLLVQLARHFGAGRVIAVASTPEKRELALKLGADVAIDADPDTYVDRVLAATGGAGADVVLDANAGPILAAAVEVLAPFGRVYSYGDAGNEGRGLVDPEKLAERNAAVGGFWIGPVLNRPEIFAGPVADMFGLITSGALNPLVSAEYPFDEVKRALTDMRERRTTGKVWLRI
ncbi:quinone oxidoreductase family protein [Stackebrandtia nassauensis]|uniref:Alcohol dehydrogenase zinc-binding domain protein n=1 Tax=Stackebrandtia nassauensis (strain DSM 44728 / CIP 108903 / NRRL B-16338 / NBRC 102104 / LLR-40K-21) TaxID=446470 RepID=D3PXB2_STANL|nr:zinc-binding dehydrogenase [Stackebrandtia nassauensis]ADD41375.1 Alcohol dehydrogenase zinc-binding domain protein [Stackebrandtia nassauensis DSM 44728]